MDPLNKGHLSIKGLDVCIINLWTKDTLYIDLIQKLLLLVPTPATMLGMFCDLCMHVVAVTS